MSTTSRTLKRDGRVFEPYGGSFIPPGNFDLVAHHPKTKSRSQRAGREHTVLSLPVPFRCRVSYLSASDPQSL